MKSGYRHNRRHQELGIYVALTALISTVLFGFIGWAIDSGHLYVVRSDLQRATASGALASTDILKNTKQPRVLYPPPGGAVICTDFATKALSIAAANGSPYSVYDGSHGCTESNDHSYCYGSYSINQSYDTPSSQVPTTDQYDVIFYDTTGHGDNTCSNSDAPWTTSIEIVSPVPNIDLPGGSNCTSPYDESTNQYPFNCVLFITTTKTQNYFMRIPPFNQAQTIIHVKLVAYGF